VELGAIDKTHKDRLAASAIAHYLIQQNMNDILAGNWEIASANVINATLQIQDPVVQLEVARIFQSLLADYQESFQAKETTTVDSVTTTVISEKDSMSTPSIAGDAQVSVEGDLTVSTSTTSTTTVKQDETADGSVKDSTTVTVQETVKTGAEDDIAEVEVVTSTVETITTSDCDKTNQTVLNQTVIHSEKKVGGKVQVNDTTVDEVCATVVPKEKAPKELSYSDQKKLTDSIKKAIDDVYSHLEYTAYILPWSSSGQKVVFNLNGFEASFFILIHFREDGTYNILVLDDTTYDIQAVYKSVLVYSERAIDNLDVVLVDARPDSHTHEFVRRFIQDQSDFVIRARELSAIAEAAAIYTHH